MSDILMQIDLPGIGSHFKNFPMGFSWLFDPEVITVLICACMIVHPGRPGEHGYMHGMYPGCRRCLAAGGWYLQIGLI